MSDQKKAVVIFSGGMDSATAVYHCLNEGWKVEALSVLYGQRHDREVGYAGQLCKQAGVPHLVVDARSVGAAVMGGSALTGGGPVPHGHYAEESMKATVVPNRNMILLAIATARAVQTKADFVVYGAHAGDHAIYPDCRPEFADAMRTAMALCDWHAPTLYRPFIGISKTEIAKLGAKLGVPYQLTYSCYEGGQKHCGKCGTCTERKEAFRDAGLVDPTEYLE